VQPAWRRRTVRFAARYKHVRELAVVEGIGEQHMRGFDLRQPVRDKENSGAMFRNQGQHGCDADRNSFEEGRKGDVAGSSQGA
jgi:hypothetical protein